MRLQTTTLPADLAAWMDTDMRAFFEALPYGQKRRYVEPIEQATRRETREWRVAHAVRTLRERSQS